MWTPVWPGCMQIHVNSQGMRWLGLVASRSGRVSWCTSRAFDWTKAKRSRSTPLAQHTGHHPMTAVQGRGNPHSLRCEHLCNDGHLSKPSLVEAIRTPEIRTPHCKKGLLPLVSNKESVLCFSYTFSIYIL